MRKTMLQRRHLLAGLAIGTIALPSVVRGAALLDAAELGVEGGGDVRDQSAALQASMMQASDAGQILRLPPGTIFVQYLDFPDNLVMEGVPGLTVLIGWQGHAIGRIAERGWLVLRDIGFAGEPGASLEAMLRVESSDNITFERCSFSAAPQIALGIRDSAVSVRDCMFEDCGDAAIHALDSRSLHLTGNRIRNCGNAGIRIWRSEPGADGSIVSNNHIDKIDWRGGGNGQNGNGINVFRADEVIIADNHISECAFSAVRLNSTRNTQLTGNICVRSGEVAIFSEFAFSGSVIANNVVDGAASGISITNFDQGGYLAVCSGNIVRNISERSEVNPDTSPVGIFAEADTAITGNTVEKVPGVGIGAGFGPYLRNVAISGNVVRETRIGIGVSVAEGAGAASIANNIIEAEQHDMAGLAWSEVVEPDLRTNSSRFPQLNIQSAAQ